MKIDCVLNTQSNPSPPSHRSFSDGEILTEFISWYLPSNKPHQDLGDQRKVGRTKVLHRYESGITQGSHHFGKIYKKEKTWFQSKSRSIALRDSWCQHYKLKMIENRPRSRNISLTSQVTVRHFSPSQYFWRSNKNAHNHKRNRWLNCQYLFTMLLWKRKLKREKQRWRQVQGQKKILFMTREGCLYLILFWKKPVLKTR